LPYIAARAIDDADGFHDASRSGNVNLPHAIDVEYFFTLGIDDERQVDHRANAGLAEQLGEFAARRFTAKVHPMKGHGSRRIRLSQIDTNYAEVRQHRQQAFAQVSRDTGNQDCGIHL